jgi:glycosyltransferase involved in cell wall biosynthesis
MTGVQRYASEICLALKKLHKNLVILAPNSAQSNPLSAIFKPTYIGSHSGVLWEQIELPRHLKKLGSPLLINLCNIAPIVYSNQCITLHDLAFMRNPRWFSKKFQLAYRTLIPRLAKRSKHIFTVSEFSKKEIVSLLGTPVSKITVATNACSLSSKSPGCQLKLFEFQKSPYLLSISSLNPRKNLLLLLRSYARISSKISLPLVIVGETSSAYGHSNELISLINKLNVIHLQRVSDLELSSLYHHAKLFIYPSLYEGFGLPPLEAISHSCQPLLSDILPHREVCGSCALYFDPHKEESLSKAIIEGIKTHLDSNLRNSCIRKYSWKKSAEQILQTVLSLCPFQTGAFK